MRSSLADMVALSTRFVLAKPWVMMAPLLMLGTVAAVQSAAVIAEGPSLVEALGNTPDVGRLANILLKLYPPAIVSVALGTALYLALIGGAAKGFFQGRVGLEAGLEGFGRRVARLLALTTPLSAATIALIILPLAATARAIAEKRLAEALAATAYVLLGLLAAFTIWVVTAYPVMVAAVRGSLSRGLKEGFRLLLRRPQTALAYSVLYSMLGLFVTLSQALQGLMMPGFALMRVAVVMVAQPAIDIGFAFTALAEAGGEPPRPPARPSYMALLYTGFRKAARFPVKHPWHVAGAVAILAAGYFYGLVEMGWVARLLKESGPAAPTPLQALGADISVHNWSIAAALVASSIAGHLVPAAILFFNGAVVGAVASAVDPRLAAAAILPHGVVEIPSFIIAAAASLWAADGWFRGDLARRIREAGYVVLGLLPFFIVAAAVESFITPVVLRIVTGG